MFAPTTKAELSETGEAVVEGLGIGRAIVWGSDPPPPLEAGSLLEEHARLARSIARALGSVEELVRLLPRAEAELFEPEIAILAELRPSLLASVDGGMRAEEAVNQAMAAHTMDVFADARARLLDGLACDDRSVAALLDGREGDRVLVTEHLTPSVVAFLPARVVGIIAASVDAEEQGYGTASHAAILARARDIPLAFVLPRVAQEIEDDAVVVLDVTGTPAFVHIAPADATVADARVRRDSWTRTRSEEAATVSAPLTHLGVGVHVNIGSISEHVPLSAEGIGLLRTELVFSVHTKAPSELEQFGALRAIVARATGLPVVVRLFDAGGDKPLAWLPPSAASADARGITLLLQHPAVLGVQLRAIALAALHADVRVLLPLVTGAEDIERVRALTHGKLSVGAMVETPDAVDRIARIAAAADFICIGTNDLSASVTGQPRANSSLGVDRRVLHMIVRIVEGARASARTVSVCGELAGDPHGARILIGLGVETLSVSPARFAKVKHSLRNLTLEDCREVACEALKQGGVT